MARRLTLNDEVVLEWSTSLVNGNRSWVRNKIRKCSDPALVALQVLASLVDDHGFGWSTAHEDMLSLLGVP